MIGIRRRSNLQGGIFVVIKEFESTYRDDLIFMVLQAKDALGA